MTDMTNEQEKRVKQLKRNLEGWREAILPLNSVFTWEQNWHPGAIVGSITIIFLLVWWLDPAVLTLVSILGLFAVLVDYLVPALTSSFCRAEWTGVKERRLEDVCRNLASAEACITNSLAGLQNWRNARPKLYYGAVISGLLISAYIGSILNNMFLTYLIVLFAALVPGLRRRGVLKHQLGAVISTVGSMLGCVAAPSNPGDTEKPKKN